MRSTIQAFLLFSHFSVYVSYASTVYASPYQFSYHNSIENWDINFKELTPNDVDQMEFRNPNVISKVIIVNLIKN